MSSFLEKLKKGMQNQAVTPDTVDESPAEEGVAVLAAYKKRGASSSLERKSKMITKASQLEEDEDSKNVEANKAMDEKAAKPAKKTLKKTMANKKITQAETDGEWLSNEGQLAVDVYQTENDLVIQAAIAGIKVEDIDVLIEDEMITIKGDRPNPVQEDGDYFIEECYWGTFSRKIILPVEVDSSRADAAMKEGILTIRIPKIQREKKKKLIVK